MKFPLWNIRWGSCALLLGFFFTCSFMLVRPTWRQSQALPFFDSMMRFSLFSNKSDSCLTDLLLDPCSCIRTLEMASCPQNDNSSSIGEQQSSTCGSWATLRGPGQKVVSYSLYGKFPGEYYTGLELLVERVKTVYPGWIVRVYIDNWSSQPLRTWACNLACKYPHVDFCDVHRLPGIGDASNSFGMTWRFSVLGDPLVERFIVRDADMPILQREVDAVNEWITLRKCYHIMRDNPFHGVPVMGGMWGGCNSWQRSNAINARTEMLKYARAKASDQPVLWVGYQYLCFIVFC